MDKRAAVVAVGAGGDYTRGAMTGRRRGDVYRYVACRCR